MESNEELYLSGNVSRHDATERDMSRHTITIKQAARLFEEHGVPRSPRSVQRFCEQGSLDAIRVKGETSERYFIDPLSVRRYAEELKQLEKISQLGNDMSRPDATNRDVTRQGAPESQPPPVPEISTDIDQETQQLRERVDTLEKENGQLRIDLGARVVIINHMVDAQRDFVERVSNQGREIGRLEMQVLQLAAPAESVTRHDAHDDVEPDEASSEEAREVVEKEKTITLTSAVVSEPVRPGFIRRVFGGK